MTFHKKLCNINIPEKTISLMGLRAYSLSVGGVEYTQKNNLFKINNQNTKESIYQAFPCEDYGWIIMDSNNSFLMIEDCAEGMEIPYIKLYHQYLDDDSDKAFVFHIVTLDWSVFVHIVNLRVAPVPKPAQEALIKLNKERRLNSKIIS